MEGNVPQLQEEDTTAQAHLISLSFTGAAFVQVEGSPSPSKEMTACFTAYSPYWCSGTEPTASTRGARVREPQVCSGSSRSYCVAGGGEDGLSELG